MKRNALALLFALLVAVMVTGCGKVPQEQINAAQMAVDSVKTIGADIYNQDEFNSLQDSLKAVIAKIEIRKSKVFKSFDTEKAELDSIIAFSKIVGANAETRKMEVMQEAGNTIDSLKSVMNENNELILKAPRGKEGASALEAMKAELAAIDSSMTEISSLYDQNNYMAALDKSKAALEKASAINVELKEAIEKTTKRRK